MIISCPSCGARYKVRDDLIPETGKRVKCKKCTSLFRAFPGKKAILEKPKQAPPKQSSAQATVMVDQSKLSSYLHQQNEEKKPTLPPDNTDQKDKKPGSHATVQIDRTKINAFLQNKVDRAGGDYEPNTTLEVSREELDNFLHKSPPDQTGAPASGQDQPAAPAAEEQAPASKINSDKFQDLQRALGATPKDSEMDKATVEMPSPAVLAKSSKPSDLYQTPSAPPKISTETPPSAEGAPANKELDLTVPSNLEASKPSEPNFADSSSEDGFWTSPSKAPEFPSDEELGLTADPESELGGSDDMPSSVSFDDPVQDEEDDFLSGSSDQSEEDEDFLAGIESEPDEDLSPPAPSFEESETLEPVAADATENPASNDSSPLYTVKVEDTEYPNKSLDALDRWIHEGRLLETDLVALVGSSDFKKAYDIPEIRAVFDRYFGQSSNAESHSEQPKKGFFGKIFSIFGKKS